VAGSSGAPIFWNNGNPASAGTAVPVGADRDDGFATADPAGSNLRYRHGSNAAQAMFADGHAKSVRKGKLQDRNLYTNY